MVINMLKNRSHRYSSHYRVIKYIGFEPIHCATNLDAISSFEVFSEFDSVFISIVILLV